MAGNGQHGRQTHSRRAAMRRGGIAALLLLVSLAGSGRPARAAPPVPARAVPAGGPAAAPVGEPTVSSISAFDDAVNTFKYQDFDNAIPKLKALLYPTTTLEQKAEWRVREYLGAALWWQGESRAALDEFTALLVRNPPTRLDPAVYPPKMISDFEGQRLNLVRLGVIQPDQAPRPPDTAPVRVEPPPYPLMFFPFGVGQFANREPAKGTAFLVAQAVLAGVSAGFYVRNRDTGLQTGVRDRTGDIVQLGTGAAFWALAGWGVWDATRGWNRQAAATGAGGGGPGSAGVGR